MNSCPRHSQHKPAALLNLIYRNAPDVHTSMALHNYASLNALQLRCRGVCQNPVTKDIFVVDGFNDVIRRISTYGDVSTVVGAAGEVGLVDGKGRPAAGLHADTCLQCCTCHAAIIILCCFVG